MVRMMTRTDHYLDFLIDIVWRMGRTAREQESMDDLLLRELFNIEFYSLIPNDENRGMDGLELRDTYFDMNKGGPQAPPSGPCTVLEMLIGLAYRLEFERAQTKWERSPKKWFWLLIDNLELDYHQNRGLSRVEYRDKIVEVVTLLLERGYKSNGEGGLFPLKNVKNGQKSAKIDQKRVEIWYQMSAYINENYPI